MKIENFVNGYNFRSLADFVVDADRVDDISLLRNKDIVFCKTDLLNYFFSKINKFEGEIILITHKSDLSITESTFLQKPKCIKKWFAQNVDFKHHNLIPIPIGIENHTGPSKGTCIDIDFVEKNLPLRILNKKKEIYCNFNNTHHDRHKTREILKKNHKSFIQNKTLSSSEYYLEMAEYLFVASPRGNGIDCHRTWEALLAGSIPIVEKHFMYDSYPNLPIIQIECWEEVVNSNFLQKQQNSFLDKKINIAPLYMDFWHKIIYDLN